MALQIEQTWSTSSMKHAAKHRSIAGGVILI